MAKNHDDVLLVGPALAGDAHAVLRQREDRVELGELRAVREGQPLSAGEIVKLRPRTEHARLFDVEVLAELPAPALGRPAQVATEAYREGWDLVFGAPRRDDHSKN